MKKTIYLIKKDKTENSIERLQEISGEEFYHLVNSMPGKKRYFIRLVDSIDYEGAEIVIETSREEYVDWRKGYDAQRYVDSLGKKYVFLPLEEAALEQQEQYHTCTEYGEPEALLLKKENYHNLEAALDSLSAEEYQLIEMLYLCENPLSLRQVAECFDVSVSTIYKRKEKILEKMRKFW